MPDKTSSSGQRWWSASVSVGLCRRLTGCLGRLGLVSGSSVSDPAGEFCSGVDVWEWKDGCLSSDWRSSDADLFCMLSARSVRDADGAAQKLFAGAPVAGVNIDAPAGGVNSS